MQIPLGSIAAFRPVFLIVMGIFLMVIAWRLSKVSDGWTARMIVAGALLLGFGYALLLPLYDAGVISRYVAGSPQITANSLGWHAVKIVAMNSGWLLFGIGVAMHAKVLTATPERRPAYSSSLPNPVKTHESAA